MLPDTTTGRRGGRRRAGPLLAATCSAAALLFLAVVTLSAGQRGFSPGEELVAPGVEDVAVSQVATTSYPRSDVLRLDRGPEVVYVYLRVEGLAADGGLRARVERSGREPVLARLFGGSGLQVLDEEEDPIGASEGRLSGVVRFAVREESGGPLPAGDYTVEVLAGDGGASFAVARKYFVVEA